MPYWSRRNRASNRVSPSAPRRDSGCQPRSSILRRRAACAFACASLIGLAIVHADEPPTELAPFGIRVVDDATGRGVPLVQLRTVHHLTFYTDSQGWAAIGAPELMKQSVYFHVSSHGYEFPADRFGYRGVRLQVEPGAEATIKIRRLNIAERLYRVTGAGIYADSIQLGKPAPIQHPLLNAQVTGSDSVVNAVYHDKVYWFWGDTNRLSYPLGNFHVPGATSLLPADGGLPPSVGVNLSYFVDERTGFAKETARMDGQGPTWINGLTVLRTADGKEHLLAGYVKVKKPMVVYARGIVEFDDEQQQFRHRVRVPMDEPLFPHGHPFLAADGEKQYVYFASPLPLVRVAADLESFLDPRRYEAYTYYREGDVTGERGIERTEDGRVVLAWKKHTARPTLKQENKLIAQGRLKRTEGVFQAVDADSGEPILLHSGSVAWNEYRQRWVMIALTSFNRSMLGEIWYGEADNPTGPWRKFHRIVSHDKYSFYNPKHHPMFDEEGGRIIYFEGTYTNTFSGNPDATPRYNYNQIMYRLDLADPRLQPAQIR